MRKSKAQFVYGDDKKVGIKPEKGSHLPLMSHQKAVHSISGLFEYVLLLNQVFSKSNPH